MRCPVASCRWATLAGLLLVGAVGTSVTADPVGAAEQRADPSVHRPKIRLISRDQDTVVRAIRVIRAEPEPPRSHVASRPFATWRWPVRGRLTSGYGRRRHPITQDQRFHTGIDLAAPSGTPVRAVAAGRVRRARWARWAGGYGHLVELDHGQGWTTRYAHLQRALVAPERRVAAGEIIALVGSTGSSTGPHLHFEIRRHGKAIDPLMRLAARSVKRLAQQPRPLHSVD
jgi:murein DD-endopeptidase MepM/ murein hydrolase activator NlpD